MIEKVREDAYFVTDDLSFVSSLNMYDPMVSNQTISFDQELEIDVEKQEQDI